MRAFHGEAILEADELEREILLHGFDLLGERD